MDEFSVPQPDRPRFEVLYPDVPDNWRTRLDMAWPIYTGGRTGALEHAADAERQATGKDLESARADLVLETTRAFWALVTATESVRVVGESITRIEAQHSDVKARYDAGFLPPNDVLTVATRVSQQRTLLLEAQNQRDGARAMLARLIGARVDADFEPDAALAEGALPVPATAQVIDLAAQARDARADRQALLFRVRGCRRTDRCGALRQSSVYRHRRRLRLRAPQSHDLPAPGHLEDIVGRRGQRELDPVERRPHRRRGRGSEAAG